MSAVGDSQHVEAVGVAHSSTSTPRIKQHAAVDPFIHWRGHAAALGTALGTARPADESWPARTQPQLDSVQSSYLRPFESTVPPTRHDERQSDTSSAPKFEHV